MGLFRKRQKVFCIGQSKTGTTSIEAALKKLGYKMGNQIKGELLLHEWAKRDFKKIIKLCRTADAFQDAPFNSDFTYQTLDNAFPGSKFILTIRNSKEEWYRSLTSFHSKLIGKNRVPTANDLKEFPYRYKGFMWEGMQLKYGINEETLYDFDIYTDQYEMHNQRIIEYFKYRKEDLLILNLSDADAMEKLYEFLDVEYDGSDMPHLNKSR